jgi:hypothetical protein
MTSKFHFWLSQAVIAILTVFLLIFYPSPSEVMTTLSLFFIASCFSLCLYIPKLRSALCFITIITLSIMMASLPANAASSSLGPRPAQWCGWHMRTILGGGPEFNIASRWRSYGSPAHGPSEGVVVVWNHHVGVIKGRTLDGRGWIVHSGNWSGRVANVPMTDKDFRGASFRK